MKHFELKVLSNIAGRPIKTLDESGEPKEADLADMLRSFVFNLPPPKLTMQDSIEARRLLESIESSDKGLLSMEEGTHDWLTRKPAGVIELYTPMIFGVNAIVIKEALEDFHKAHPKEEKKEEEEGSGKEVPKAKDQPKRDSKKSKR